MRQPKFNENALAVLRERYLWKNEEGEIIETPEEMLERVAGTVASVESHEKRLEYAKAFYNIMAALDFLPNSPTLMNAGRPGKHGQLSACYVIGIEDTMESIFEALKKQAIIHKSGGGTGFNFSALRPAGAVVESTNGKASGPVSFMELFNLSTDVVQQGGMRRGANMGILDCDHPDLDKFIRAKGVDGKFHNFNISVSATDEFMKKAAEGNNPDFDKIVSLAWQTGDPGLVFIDAINRANPTPHLGKLKATNPCVTGDTLILTSEGYQKIKDCVGKSVEVWNGHMFSKVFPRVTGNNQEIMTVRLSNGVTINCTPYHSFILNRGFSRDGKVERTEAQHLKQGDKLAKHEFPVIRSEGLGLGLSTMYINGFFTGDGYLDVQKGCGIIQLYGEKQKLVHLFTSHARTEPVSHPSGEKTNVRIGAEHLYPKFWVPDCDASVEERLGWLAGLIDSDGTRNSSEGSVCISSINEAFLKRVQLMLTTLGTASTVAVMKKACKKRMPDGTGSEKEYNCAESYRLTIPSSGMWLLNRLGLKTYRVDTKASPSRNASRFVKVVSVERTGEVADAVYCFTEEIEHAGTFNGVLLGNCGETPLYPDEACNLGSINLSNMVLENGTIDYMRLENTVDLAVRFLDNVIDVNHYPLPEIREAVMKTRKVGLGVMGWAEMLFKMRIPYNTDKAVDLAYLVMKFINDTAKNTSHRLAMERGPYPASTVEPYRNATVTCIAPTGTISLLAGCSSGIEPVFALRHKRIAFAENGEGGKTLEYFNPVYEEACGDLCMDDETLESVFVTSHDIAPVWHILHQAAFQKHTDLAVSKTINLHHDATEEDVRCAYLFAWEMGCKGVTVYRDGCKMHQVLYKVTDGETCPQCGAKVKHQDGCISCTVCSWGKCSV